MHAKASAPPCPRWVIAVIGKKASPFVHFSAPHAHGRGTSEPTVPMSIFKCFSASVECLPDSLEFAPLCASCLHVGGPLQSPLPLEEAYPFLPPRPGLASDQVDTFQIRLEPSASTRTGLSLLSPSVLICIVGIKVPTSRTYWKN